MSFLVLDSDFVWLALAVFAMMGAIALEVFRFFQSARVGFIAKVMEKVGDTYSVVKRIKVGITQESFHVGELEFVKDETKVFTREPWNHWGGNKPVLVYDMRDAKPMDNSTDPPRPAVKGSPKDVRFTRNEKPGSGTVNMIFRRGGWKAALAATKHTSMDPKLGIIVGLVIGAAAIFMVTQFWHPGLVSAPPGGYFYKVLPIPANVTVVH